MDVLIFNLLLLIVFILLMALLISSLKGKLAVYLIAVTATMSAWFIGLLLDANIEFGEPDGFLSFRILLPILAMGICILRAIMKDKTD